MPGPDVWELQRLVTTYGLRRVLNTLAEICESHHDKALPVLLEPGLEIEPEDLLTVAANLRGDLF